MGVRYLWSRPGCRKLLEQSDVTFDDSLSVVLDGVILHRQDDIWTDGDRSVLSIPAVEQLPLIQQQLTHIRCVDKRKPINTPIAARDVISRKIGGIGTAIKQILTASGISPGGCGCNDKARQWDANGVEWCRDHQQDMTAWLVEQAGKNKFNFAAAGIKLAASYPVLAAKIAAAVIAHPLRYTEAAASEIIRYAIDAETSRLSKSIASLPVLITAAPRRAEIQRRSYESVLQQSQLGPVTVLTEPGTDLGTYAGAKVVQHQERLGQWRNLVAALRAGIDTGEQFFITLEDDVTLHPQLGEMLLSRDWQWPSDACGCLQLYTSAKYRTKYRRGGRWRLKPSESFDMLGACALMFRRDAAEVLVASAETDGWRGDTGAEIAEPSAKKAGDTWIGEVLTRAGYEIWIHNPSLAEHIGTDSTLGHEKFDARLNRKTLDYPGDQTDLFSIFTLASKMKIIAIYKTFDGGEFVDASLASIYDHCDHIVMVHSDVSWLGERGNSVRHRAARWCEQHDAADKVHHVDVDLTSQEAQYQAALEYIRDNKLAYDVILVIDADEIWEDKYLEAIRRQIVDHPFPAYRCNMVTYLKTPFYRVEPHFGSPTTFLRDPSWLLKSPRACKAPAWQLKDVWMHHYTYVRETREAVERKLHQSCQADGGEMVVPNWMETVYDRMPEGKDLHAFVRWRSSWNHLEKVWLPDVPPAMRQAELFKLWLPEGKLMDGEQAAIYRLAKGRKQAVDLGTYRGLSAVILGLACDRVHTIDAYEQRPSGTEYDILQGHSLEATRALCNRFGNMACEQSDTIEASGHWSGPPVDVLFVDADHSENGTLGNVFRWLPHVATRGLVMLHDDNELHPGVRAAVARLDQMGGLNRVDPGEFSGSLAVFEVASRYTIV